MSDLNQIQHPAPYCYQKREQLKVNIRKEKLMNLLNSKRFKFQVPQAESTFPEGSWENLLLNLKNKLLTAMEQENPEETVKCITSIREVVNGMPEMEEIGLSQILYKVGLLEMLANMICFENSKNDQLMEELFWIFINLSAFCEEFWDIIIKNGLVDRCIQMVLDPESSYLIKQNALWFLSNAVGDPNGVRETLLNIQFMDKILFLIDNSDNKFAVKYKEHFLFMFQNMIKQTPKLKHEQYATYVPRCIEFLDENTDYTIPECCLTILSILCVEVYGEDKKLLDWFVKQIRQKKGYKKLVTVAEKTTFLENEVKHNILAKITKIIGTISFSDSLEDLHYFLDEGLLEMLLTFLNSNINLVTRNAAWTFSNLMCSGSNIVAKLMLNERFINKALCDLRYSHCEETRYNLLIGFSNALQDISEFSLQKLRNKGLINVFLELISPAVNSLDLMEIALETIYLMITAYDDETTGYLKEIDQKGGRRMLEQLTLCDHEKIRERACELLDNYFQDIDSEMNN